ncbi:MAG: hypothetical protein CMP81_25400 [Fulvimarina sp.]|nr:hypothetical protein [Fulvimarina sp.]
MKFTPGIYEVSDKIGEVASVERLGDDYLLTMKDGYRVSLFGVTRTSMTWHSPQSGDTFECRKIDN